MSDLFFKRMSLFNNEVSEKIRKESNLLMEKNFANDAAFQMATLYDCNLNKLENIKLKFQYSQKYTINKDQVEYLIQFPPLYHPEKKYIQHDNIERFGFFLDIKDEAGETNKWLILGKNDSSQFVRYNVLKCNYIFKYIVNGKIYKQLGVIRDRNNYNSGVWSDGFVTSVENQAMFIVPTNDNTNLIDYGMRFMLSDNKINPLVYEITKRSDTFPFGIQKFVLSQNHFDPKLDNPYLGICDYYSSIIQEDTNTNNFALIYNGTKPVLYLGGSKRIITVDFFNNNIPEIVASNWSFELNNIPKTIEELNQFFNIDFQNNQVLISAKKDFTMVGNILTIYFTHKNQKANLQLEVITR